MLVVMQQVDHGRHKHNSSANAQQPNKDSHHQPQCQDQKNIIA